MSGWLIGLYSFLAATSALALLSVAFLWRGVRDGLRPALLLLLPAWLLVNAVFAYTVHRTAYAIESRDPFCVSCHLHEKEFAAFREQESSVAVDLAGFHSRRGDRFTCITCHGGEGVRGRARVLFFAGMDVVHYASGSFQHDLDGMKHPLSDAACTKCHAPQKIGGFHASPKHAQYTAECLSCHAAHPHGDEVFGFIDYHRWRPTMAEPCLECHPALLG